MTFETRKDWHDLFMFSNLHAKYEEDSMNGYVRALVHGWMSDGHTDGMNENMSEQTDRHIDRHDGTIFHYSSIKPNYYTHFPNFENLVALRSAK